MTAPTAGRCSTHLDATLAMETPPWPSPIRRSVAKSRWHHAQSPLAPSTEAYLRLLAVSSCTLRGGGGEGVYAGGRRSAGPPVAHATLQSSRTGFQMLVHMWDPAAIQAERAPKCLSMCEILLQLYFLAGMRPETAVRSEDRLRPCHTAAAFMSNLACRTRIMKENDGKSHSLAGLRTKVAATQQAACEDSERQHLRDSTIYDNKPHSDQGVGSCSLAGLSPKVAVTQQSACNDAVWQQLQAVLQSEVCHAVLRAPVQQQVLHLLWIRSATGLWNTVWE